jgi:hypothetical protein
MNKCFARSTALLAATVLLLAGCSDEKNGTPSAAPSSPAQSQTGAASSTPGSSDSAIASINPCSLIGAADLASYGTFGAPESDNVGGARVCRLIRERASASDETLTVSVGIRDAQGIDSVNDAGGGKTSGKVNGRKAMLVPTPPEGCLMALELGASARADVVSVSADPEKACGVVEKVADIVEPKLPKG